MSYVIVTVDILILVLHKIPSCSSDILYSTLIPENVLQIFGLIAREDCTQEDNILDTQDGTLDMNSQCIIGVMEFLNHLCPNQRSRSRILNVTQYLEDLTTLFGNVCKSDKYELIECCLCAFKDTLDTPFKKNLSDLEPFISYFIEQFEVINQEISVKGKRIIY